MQKNKLGILVFFLMCLGAFLSYMWINEWNKGTLVLETNIPGDFEVLIKNKTYHCNEICSLKLTPDSYSLILKKEGYLKAQERFIEIRFNQVKNLDFKLKPEPVLSEITNSDLFSNLPSGAKNISPDPNLEKILYTQKNKLVLKDRSKKFILPEYLIYKLIWGKKDKFVFLGRNSSGKLALAKSNLKEEVETITSFEKIMANAITWSTQNNVIVLSSNNGVYLVDLTTKRKKLVVEEKTSLAALSQNGKYLAYAPKKLGEKIIILDLDNNEKYITQLDSNTNYFIWSDNELIFASRNLWKNNKEILSNADIEKVEYIDAIDENQNRSYTFFKFFPKEKRFSFLYSGTKDYPDIKNITLLEEGLILIQFENNFYTFSFNL